MSPSGRISVVVAAVLGIAVIAAVLTRRRPVISQSVPSAPASLAVADVPEADWCAAGFEPIPGGACFAAPAATPAPPRLLIYLHGRYARDVTAEETDRQRRLGQRATARGFAVLAFRGQLGECTAPELATWFCWPSNEHNADNAPEFVGAWARALAAAEERVGQRTRYVLGFSNGGYFAGLLAVRGLFDATAFVVAHGGPVEPIVSLPVRVPILLLSADDDISQDEMIRFDEELVREKWAHDSYARSGGHALTDEDIDAAIAFFSRAGEALPLDPPLPLHRPVHHSHEADAAVVGVTAAEDAVVPVPAAEDAL
jgi:predicted esterase